MYIDQQMDMVYAFKEYDHEHTGFDTQSEVPGGMYCTICNKIVYRFMPPPENEPELIGYQTADWVWHYKDGKPWTKD